MLALSLPEGHPFSNNGTPMNGKVEEGWQAIEDELLKRVRSSKGKIRPRDLVHQVAQELSASEATVRKAVWRLVNRGRLDFNRERRVEIAQSQ